MKEYVGDQRTLGYMLQDVASVYGPKTFVYFGEQKLSYSEVDNKSNQIANSLLSMGLQKGSRVGVMLPNCSDYVLLQFGIAKAGLVQVPYNTEARGSQLAHFINNSQPEIVIVDEEFIPVLETVKRDIVIQPRLLLRSKGTKSTSHEISNLEPFSKLLDGPTTSPQVKVRMSDLLAIFYTSGTTGVSKGVMLPHHHNWYLPSLIAKLARMTDKDVVYSPLPYYHGVSQYMSTVPAMLVGGSVALAEKFSASRFWDEIKRYQATVFWSVYTLPSILMKQPPRPGDGKTSLRVFFTMGMDPTLWDAFEKRFNVKVISNYGSTEQDLLAATPYNERRIGSAGKITPDFEVAIVDENDNPLPVGQIGEIVSRPRIPFTQMLGYYNMPDQTVKATRNLWLHSGELGYIDKDGWFFFAGRLKDAIRKGGENVSAEEVESIINKHPAVLESAVTALASELGEDEIKADIVLKPQATLSPGELIEYCKDKMSKAMLPRYIRIRNSIPKTGTEKVQKAKIREEGLTPDTWDGMTRQYVK